MLYIVVYLALTRMTCFSTFCLCLHAVFSNLVCHWNPSSSRLWMFCIHIYNIATSCQNYRYWRHCTETFSQSKHFTFRSYIHTTKKPKSSMRIVTSWSCTTPCLFLFLSCLVFCCHVILFHFCFGVCLVFNFSLHHWTPSSLILI